MRSISANDDVGRTLVGSNVAFPKISQMRAIAQEFNDAADISVSSARDVLKHGAKACFWCSERAVFLRVQLVTLHLRAFTSTTMSGTGGMGGWATSGVWQCLEGKSGSCRCLHAGTMAFLPQWHRACVLDSCDVWYDTSCMKRTILQLSLVTVTHVLSR